MTRLFSRTTLAGCVAFAAAIQAGAPAYAAGFLFDHLFGGNRRQPAVVEEQPPARPPAPPPAPRVAGPQYYTYKVDPLVKVDFSKLAAPAVSAADPQVTHSVKPLVQEQAASSAEPTMISDLESSAAEAVSGMDPAEFALAVSALSDFELRAEKQISEAMLAYYADARDFIWVTDGAPNDSARAALSVLADADSEGLGPEDYAVALPSDDEGAAIRFEMELSARVLRYVRDAQQGRINPNRISGYHDFAQKPLDWKKVLSDAKSARDPAEFLRQWHPKNPAYAELRKELAALRASVENEIVIAAKTLIKPGQSNPEFPKVLQVILRDMDDAYRAEFGVLLERYVGTETYVAELVPAIKAAQKARGLADDGVIGSRTIAALAGESRAARIDKVLVAMEQLRWLPSEFAPRHVFINVPAFKADYVEDGGEKLSMKIVVGTRSTQTFFFQDEIEYVEFNPYWGIPRSILVNKYLPKLYGNPGYLDQIGYEVTDGGGRRIPSSAIDWTRYGANPPFDVRQPPGPKNSLGAMKIMFPNEHAIYMHDTPERHLFDRESRAFSNGCVRLQDPRAMAAAVLGWDRAAIDERIKGGQNNRANLSVKVPVYVVYFTAWPNRAGTVDYVPDVYDRDSHVLSAMKKVADLRAPSI